MFQHSISKATMRLLAVCILLLLCGHSLSEQQNHSNVLSSALLDDFVESYWTHNNWKGASSWTGDNASRLMINYLIFLHRQDHRAQVDDIFAKVASRSLNRWTILQYLTQGYDDFGWTVYCLLEILRYTYHHEQLYPESNAVKRLPWLRNRLAFRVAFLHDIMEDSWSPEFCDGGSEWKVRARKLSLWPSIDFREVYKNSITNHLYNSNNAQTYKAYLGKPQPGEITETGLYYLRWLWKIVRPGLGWPRSRIKRFDFTDVDLVYRAQRGLDWMAQAQLLTNDSLYVDGQRIRFVQNASTMHPELLCDARVNTVFTYNQVAGIRAQWYLSRVTGAIHPIQQGHQVIQNLIRSTYQGRLGSNGILKDDCDPFSNCTQDMQIFKGLPFLDIKNYCESIHWMNSEFQLAHRRNCSSYRSWVSLNAAAAYATVDRSGKFGSYWALKVTDSGEAKQIRSIETQVAGLSVLLTALWFDRQFSEGTVPSIDTSVVD